jgi:epoxide hydrolase-like predicted phosphatase
VSYRGLILDFGGVVTTDLSAELSAFCIREGLPPDAIVHALRDTAEGREAFAAVETGRIPQRTYEVTMGRLLGVDDHGLLTRALGGLRPRPEVLNLVHRVRQAGIPVAILSNSWGEGEYDPYRGYDLDALFDAIVLSGLTGLRKPDPAIYLLAAEKIGVPPEACIFVDDSAANLPPAAALGMASVHFTDGPAGVEEISRLLGFRNELAPAR